MPTEVPADVATVLQNMVKNGYFHDTDEALRAGVKLLNERSRRLEWLRSAIAEADAQIERGEGVLLTPELMIEIDREADEMVRRGEMPSPDVCPKPSRSIATLRYPGLNPRANTPKPFQG